MHWKILMNALSCQIQASKKIHQGKAYKSCKGATIELARQMGPYLAGKDYEAGIKWFKNIR